MAPSDGRGYATGALFMTGFGAVWALGATGAASTSGIQTVVAFACVVAIAIALLVPSLALWRSAQQLPHDDPERQVDETRTRRLFNLVFLTQGAAIALTVIICTSIDQTEYIPPVIAIIVGAHFLPLAALFHVRLYSATGALMMLIPVVVMIALPESREIGPASVWTVIPMAGSAVVLWVTAAGVLRLGRAALKTSSS